MNKHLLAKITLLGAAQLFTFHTAFADIPLTPAQFAKAKTENFALYTTNFTEPLSYQGSAFLKLPKFP
ncbi:hypothetical protein CAS83_10335 [Acinetobacter baumannii]|nr:hypothetical protein CAS83_10335 [Acinetobacter baumannii]